MIHLITNQNKLIDETDVYKVHNNIDYLKEWLVDKDKVGIDTETEGFFDYKNKVITLQIGDGDNQFVIDYPTLGLEDKKILNDILFSNNSITKIFHNAKFDIKFLWEEGFNLVNVWCTQLAEAIIHAGKETDPIMEEINKKVSIGKKTGSKWTGFLTLQRLVYSYIGEYISKEVRGKIIKQGLTTEVIKYAARDVEYLDSIMLYQKDEIDIHKLNDVVELEQQSLFPLAMIEYYGISLDITKWQETKKKINASVEEAEKAIKKYLISINSKYVVKDYTLFGTEDKMSINLKSSQQKLAMLQSFIPELESTQERFLNKYKKEYKIVNLLVDYNKKVKLKSSFGDRLEKDINPTTGKIHTNIWQILATGRISTSNPCLHQIPAHSELGKEIKASFVSRKGYSFIGCDYSGQELRVLAQLSKEPVWLEILNSEDSDLHTRLAMKTFGIEKDKVRTPSPIKNTLTYRDVQKTLNFGLAYGMSEYKLSEELGISVEEAKQIIKDFFKEVPTLYKFLTKLGQFGVMNGYIRTYPYRRIRWLNIDGSPKSKGAAERQAKNHPIQGTSADMVKRAMCLIYNKIQEHDDGTILILQVHDEIILEVKDEYTNKWVDILKDCMQQASREIIPDVKMPLDAWVSKFWSH